MWECPQCRREFKATNQWHSCYVSTVEEHFEGKSSNLRKLYDELEKFMLSLDNFTITPTKTAIHFRKTSTFAEIKLRNNYLIISFSLDDFSNTPLVHKTFRMSKNKIVHSIQISSQNELEIVFQLLTYANKKYSEE